uniref:Uncharacterized protein n=1 Tax=Oryza sativa subsp. japonica TaxID=39947 RepID=Q6K1X1_ORYSJ|nr:hypothetical protein [Oryza sativa Japonica Group]BAD20160.1 hypothetical protein [Oryza sativa Japonica Group]
MRAWRLTVHRLAAGAAEARDDDDPGRGGRRQSRPATARRAAVAADNGAEGRGRGRRRCGGPRMWPPRVNQDEGASQIGTKAAATTSPHAREAGGDGGGDGGGYGSQRVRWEAAAEGAPHAREAAAVTAPRAAAAMQMATAPRGGDDDACCSGLWTRRRSSTAPSVRPRRRRRLVLSSFARRWRSYGPVVGGQEREEGWGWEWWWDPSLASRKRLATFGWLHLASHRSNLSIWKIILFICSTDPLGAIEGA